ncbi:MAG: hypothetical protein ACR2QB_03055 [Gammaproteobacteria bacterium]
MSAASISATLHRASSVWTLIAATALYGFFLTSIMPQQAQDSAAYAGDWGGPDQHFFYTPAELYTHIPTWTDAGRRDYIEFRLGWDIGWALVYTFWLVTATSLALRGAFPAGHPRRLLNLPVLLPGLLDLAENLAGIVLVANADTRLDLLAWLTAGLTASKWLTLIGAHVILVYALSKAIVQAIRRRLGARSS